MDNASLSTEVSYNFTTVSSVEDDGDFDHDVGKFVLEIINLVIGTIGVLDT